MIFSYVAAWTKAEKGSDSITHYITRLSDSYKVSGDSCYTQNGSICLPLGTITVEEKSAPKGCLMDGAYLQVNGTSERVTGVYAAQIRENGKPLENDKQTVTITERIITMHTNAADKATGEKTIDAGNEVTIVDTVSLDGIEKGVKYQLKGWEMIKSE